MGSLNRQLFGSAASERRWRGHSSLRWFPFPGSQTEFGTQRTSEEPQEATPGALLIYNCSAAISATTKEVVIFTSFCKVWPTTQYFSLESSIALATALGSTWSPVMVKAISAT